MTAVALRQIHPANDFAQTMAARLRAMDVALPRADQAVVLVFDASTLRDDVGAATALLDRHERTRASRFRYRDDRDTYTLAHAVWRITLGVCLALDPAEVPLARTEQGQPRLAGTVLSTSLSHSGTLVAIAVCPAATVGVDIETFPPRVDLDALMPVFCTADEMAQLSTLDAFPRQCAQLELWTRKEALLKAFGVGLLTDPAATPAPAAHLLLPPADAAHYPPCHTRNLAGSDGWVGAVAAPSAVRDIRVHLL